MNTWRRVLLLLMMLWLPMQSVVAVAMPMCQARHAPSATHGDAAHASHHDAGAHRGAAGHDAHHDGGAHDCSGCGACHLACAPLLGVRGFDFAAAFAPVLIALEQPAPPLHTLEQPHPPPLA